MKNYPEKTKFEKALDFADLLAKADPTGIASPVIDFIKSFFGQSFEDRQKLWLKDLAEKVQNMTENQQAQVSAFFNSEEGKTLFLQATKAAISTHKQDKLLAIRNVLLNTACNSNLHYDLKEVYLGIIMELESYDLALLKIINTHYLEFEKVNSYKEAFIIAKNKEFKGDEDVFFLIINKLKSKSLIRVSDDIGGFNDVFSASHLLLEDSDEKPTIKVTDLTKKIIEYVEETASS